MGWRAWLVKGQRLLITQRISKTEVNHICKMFLNFLNFLNLGWWWNGKAYSKKVLYKKRRSQFVYSSTFYRMLFHFDEDGCNYNSNEGIIMNCSMDLPFFIWNVTTSQEVVERSLSTISKYYCDWRYIF